MADIQVVLNQTLYAQQIRNVLHFFTDADIDAAGRQDIADYIRSNWVASGIASDQVGNWSLDSVSIRECANGGPYAEVSFTNGALVGSYAAGETPSQIALLVSLINAGLTAPTRGRIYLAGVNLDSLTDGGLFPNTTLDKAEDLVNGLREATTAGAAFLDLRIASRK